MIASLPMYLRPENRAAYDALWALIRDALRDAGISAPDTLSQDAPIAETWGRDDLVLGQICNLPYRVGFMDRVTLIGTGAYDLPKAEAGEYYSVFLARADDPRRRISDFADARFAYNEPRSQSGWGGPWHHTTSQGFSFINTLQTGAHLESARAVAEGRADLAALDAVTWSMLERWEPFAKSLQVIDTTAPSPGLAYITAGAQDPAPYLKALNAALDGLPERHQTTLGLRAIIAVSNTRYGTLPIPDLPPS